MDVSNELCQFIAAKFNAGQAVARDQSLFYSGMVDSLGIQEIAAWLNKRGGAKRIVATDIVENDLDTVDLLVKWVGDGDK